MKLRYSLKTQSEIHLSVWFSSERTSRLCIRRTSMNGLLNRAKISRHCDASSQSFLHRPVRHTALRSPEKKLSFTAKATNLSRNQRYHISKSYLHHTDTASMPTTPCSREMGAGIPERYQDLDRRRRG